ncbi:hypothetical protein EBZ39_01700 [bacterium]|nr:hypothetical protein [bacterium]
MKSCFAAVVLAFVSSVAFAGDAGEPKSVLVQPAAPAIAAEPACANGTCCTESSCRGACRAGLFGRTIERTRTVTSAVVEVPVRVVTAPARVVRARGCRGCCCQ